MILASLLTVVLASLTGTTSADQIVYDAIHNATGIAGTWSSGAQNVLTGPVSFSFANIWFDLFYLTSFVSQGFANPANMSFTYPPTTGVSYSLCVFSPPLSSGRCFIIVLVQMMGSMRFHGIGSIAMVCEVLSFSRSYALIHR